MRRQTKILFGTLGLCSTIFPSTSQANQLGQQETVSAEIASATTMDQFLGKVNPAKRDDGPTPIGPFVMGADLQGTDLGTQIDLGLAVNAIKVDDHFKSLEVETSLGSVADLEWITEEGAMPNWWVSPNGKRFACRKSTSSGQTISVDGSQLGTWDTIICEIKFSPNSQHYAFIVGQNQDGHLMNFLVIDGVPGSAYAELDDEIAFTSDSSQVIFGQTTAGGTSVLIRPVDSKQAAETGHRFAANPNVFLRDKNGGVGYVAAFSDREEAVYFNGLQIGDRYADIDPKQVAISADGQHVAFFAEISPVRLGLVLDGKIVREHNQFDQGTIIDYSLTLSPNGHRMAWGARLNGRETMFVDGKSGSAYEVLDFPVFSPNSSRFAYLAMKEGSPLIVIDGIESEKYAMASEPEFSEDGRTVAYYAELGRKEFMIVNGNRHRQFESVSTPQINSDGSVVAYVSVDGDENLVIVNGEVKAKHSIAGSPDFIPRSNKLAWLAFDDGPGWRMVVDGIDQFAFEDFEGEPVFSPDGQHIAIVTVGEKGKALMIDGTAGNAYERILAQNDIQMRFDEVGNCHYLAVRNNELFLVETKNSN